MRVRINLTQYVKIEFIEQTENWNIWSLNAIALLCTDNILMAHLLVKFVLKYAVAESKGALKKSKLKQFTAIYKIKRTLN